MRVFVTGATGFVGSAVIQELRGAGHQVLGLARSDEAAAALSAQGIAVQRGELTDLASLTAGAQACDGVIHTAFIHDFSKFMANAEIDRRAIEAIGAALAGSGKPFIITSGMAGLAAGRMATETDVGDPGAPVSPRLATEDVALGFAARGVRAMVVRLPPSVHGDGDHGFVPMVIGIARQKGVSAQVGDGLNRWPAVHRLDAALLYRLALENGEAGSRYHAVGDEGVPVRELAEVIGRRLGLPVVSKTREEAGEHFGFLGHFLGMDCTASSALTQARLGWRATRPGWLADVDRPVYFGG